MAFGLNKRKMEPVVKLAEKWIEWLRKTPPEEIAHSAMVVKRVIYIKGDGEPYYELVLHETPVAYVEVTTEGMMYVQYRDNYVLFTLDAKKTRDLLPKLKEVAKVLEGGDNV